MPETPERPYLWKWDKDRYKRSYLFAGPSESAVQQDIRTALSYMRIEAAVVDAGAAGIRGKVWGALMKFRIAEAVAKAIMQAITNVSAAPPGWSDLNGCLPPLGRAFYIEVKAPAQLDPARGTVIRPAGVPTPEQLTFLDRMAARGAVVGVAWSVQDALDIITPHLQKKLPVPVDIYA